MNEQKFQTVSVTYQIDAETKSDAIKNFQLSCKICASKGLHIYCKQCAVAAANNMVLTVFNDLEKFNNKKEK